MGKLGMAGWREKPAGVGDISCALVAGPGGGRSPDAPAASTGRELVQFNAMSSPTPRHRPDAVRVYDPSSLARDSKLVKTLELPAHGITCIIYHGTDQEKICSKRISKHWENFDDAMTNAHGENWEEDHPELDAEIIYDAAGRMPHGRLGIANELFTKIEKSNIKSRRVSASQPLRSAREDRLERENGCLKQENKRLRFFG